MRNAMKKSLFTSVAALGLVASIAQADQVILDDLIVDGSACVGLDCVNGESFGFDTIRVKENNVRFHFQDTSASASFPTNDWRLTANDSTNGGSNYFGIQDVDANRFPFRVEAGARNNALYVEADSDVGIGTSNPAVNLHAVDGNTPTLRLEQDGSSGFTPQTYDIAANEANFFIRDVTNGSALVFRTKPGAPQDSIHIAADGDLGFGTSSPEASVHIRRTSAAAGVDMLKLESNDILEMIFENNSATAAVNVFKFSHNGNEFRILNQDTAGTTEFALDEDGNLSLLGSLTVNVGSTPSSFPDYVFEEGYNLMPLSEVENFIAENGHLPRIPSAADVAENGINVSELQIALLEKVEELTLYTLAQQKRIDELTEQLQ
ncbi:hypothetical protein TRP8649_00178 [Pelagimonas phthalicica]|uniref:Uncharacterized protein n=2 Tax=Pelagimonas phthalicica TaxID=1037362 RepID=A0A238J6W1_9RHOB|nr:hypothetical protein CLV87_1894 [Pelagimonas phthalicica]SMX26105.1 hypothetical protein TRP8649_00178 [Pelagimonas phthalicica]